ncbi:hypothetical protein BBK82_41380 [Lentzea guizhouensis]|uniref:Uncharacterized protein n=1 Tax=Lentzea guizhouensis TaxID=1586287 RepID=A0A1B2HUP3_9PSEU|nr:hypothetical protein [Lentzea guizhouensis]ANZ41454.1 hypothetical protein BBK82_41380 [Lentzea guizhouensis]
MSPDQCVEAHELGELYAVRALDVSEHARGVERGATQELNLLLAGDQLHRDVLGLITAAGGGVTLDDLEHLAGQSRFDIEPLLGDGLR